MSFSAPLAADRGKFFSAALPQFTAATPASAQTVLLPRPQTGAFSIRNTAHVHAAIATVIEGVLERVVVPYQSGTGALSLAVDLKGNSGQQGAANLLQGYLQEALRTVAGRNRLAEIRRNLPADHWAALSVAAYGVLESMNSVALTVGGDTVVVYPPCAPSPWIGSGFRTTTWRSAPQIDLGGDVRSCVCALRGLNNAIVDALDSVAALVGASVVPWTPDVTYENAIANADDVWSPMQLLAVWDYMPTTRACLDILWFCQAVCGLVDANFADVPVVWTHPTTTTTVEHTFTIAPDGTVSTPTSGSPTVVSANRADIHYERGATFTASPDSWDMGEVTFFGIAECPIQQAIWDPDENRPVALASLPESGDAIVTYDITRDRSWWRTSLTQASRDVLDSLPSPSSIQCTVTTRLVKPTGNAAATTVEDWPAAGAFSRGHVRGEQFLAFENYVDGVRLFAPGEDPDGNIVWVPTRTPLDGTRYRLHAAAQTGGTSSRLATTLAAQLAAEAEAACDNIFPTSQFTMPTPIAPVGAPGQWPTEQGILYSLLEKCENAQLYFNLLYSPHLSETAWSYDPQYGAWYAPYKIVIDGIEAWRYAQADVHYEGSIEAVARSQHATAPDFEEAFTLSAAARALLGIDWTWKSMPSSAQ